MAEVHRQLLQINDPFLYGGEQTPADPIWRTDFLLD